MFNKVTDKLDPMLMVDGEVRELNRIRFGAINGVIALGLRKKKGVLHKSLGMRRDCKEAQRE